MSLFSFFGCGHNAPAPQSAYHGPARLDSFYYTATHGYRGFTNRGYRAERLEDDAVRITVELGDDRDRIFIADAAVMDSLEAIVKEFKMNRYKERYKPVFDIKDGDSWEFYLDYSNGKKVRSGGYEAKPDGANEAFDKIEAFFAPYLNIEPEDNYALVAFRYELHTQGEGSEVFWLKKDESHNTLYFRKMGDRDGWTYSCADAIVLARIAKELRYFHACSYCGENLSEEDASRPRWIAIIEYADGRKFELLDYLDRDDKYQHRPPTNFERQLRYLAEQYFGEEIERIGTLPPEQIGEHSCTTYDASGKPSRTINYAGDGTVLGGRDYDDPDLDF